VVADAIAGDPPYYKIKDMNEEILKGTFYDSELQKMIKWFGYPETFNSWVHKHDISYA